MPIPCPPGTFVNRTGTSELIHCDLCPSATYNNLPGQAQCSLCAIGTYSMINGAKSKSACELCVEGSYCPTPNETHQCEFSSHCPIGVASPMEVEGIG